MDAKAVQHIAKTLTENGVVTYSMQIVARNRCEVEAWVACTLKYFGRQSTVSRCFIGCNK